MCALFIFATTLLRAK